MADNYEYKLDPGPLKSDVLTGQLTHRSQEIWEGSVNMILNTRREDGNFWKLVEKFSIHPRVLEVIRLSGLYGVYRSNQPDIDRSLITALVERWRSETHTFHFRIGEATITLQDVEVLYELPVNGDAILGDETTRTIGDWQNICQRLLGFLPSRDDFKANSLNVAAFNAHLLSQPQMSDMATQEAVNQMARCYMFWLIADMLMADTSGGYLKLIYLPMLEDIDKIGSYSWGSATLVYLYHFLCKASQSTQNEIAGFLPLLQIWAWERITNLSPQIVGQRDTGTIFPTGLPRGPHATKWFAHLSWTKTTKHVLKIYRDALDSMTEDQARHIHLMVDEAKTLGDKPSYEALYMFRKKVRDQGSDCLKYVHETDRIYVSVDYRRDVAQPVQLRPPVRRRGKGSVAGRRERAIERGQASIGMDLANSNYDIGSISRGHTQQNTQVASEDDQANSNYDIGSISRGHTQEFTDALSMTYQPSQIDIMPNVMPQTPQISRDPSLSSLENAIGSYQSQHFDNVPNFTSSPVPLDIETPGAINILEDPNNQVGCNNPKDANKDGDTTIQDDEPSRRGKRKIKLKPCGTGGHYAIQHVKKKKKQRISNRNRNAGYVKQQIAKKGKGFHDLRKHELILFLYVVRRG